MKTVFMILLLAGFLCNADCFGQSFSLIDINPGSGSSNPQNLTKVNSTLFFKVDNTTQGYDLWKSDGTLAGTSFIKTFPGGFVFGTSPDDHNSLRNLTDVNGILFFAGDDGIHGPELWKSDGTVAGTVLVKDIVPNESNSGTVGNYTSHLTNLTNVNGTLFFQARDHVNGTELWKSDGTEAGTVLVKDIYPGTDGSSSPLNGDPQNLTAVGTILFFTAQTALGTELWKSDGTDAGTILVKDINSGAGSSNPINLTNVNGILFFYANDGVHGYELWKSDGTAAGTVMVKDINSGANNSYTPGTYGLYLTNVNGTLYFNADDGTGHYPLPPNGSGAPRENYELWKSDGTAAGTVMVKNIANDPGIGDYSSIPEFLTNVNGTLYFRAQEYWSGSELWKSDGTETGTMIVKDIVTSSTNGSYPLNLTAVNNLLFFSADDGINGREIWRSNGTGGGTYMVQDIESGSGSSNPQNLTNVNGLLFFSATTTANGTELYVSVGSAAPLPLNLLEFSVRQQQKDAVLEWTTAQEKNTLSFVVERSLDGRNYTTVGNVAAANSNSVHQYSFTDAGIVSSGAAKLYYRLQQKDMDGRFTYSRIVILPLTSSNQGMAMLYPNPVSNEASVLISLPNEQKLQWQVIDNAGRVMQQGSRVLPGGSTSITINVATLERGVYYLKLQSGWQQQQIKLVKE